MPDKSESVAMIQLASGSNVSANLAQSEKLLRQAADAGAGLAVLPENFGFMGNLCTDMHEHAEAPGDGPIQEFLGATAKRLGIWVVGGTLPLKCERDDRVRASCLVFNDQGAQAGRYDKIHLFDVEVPGSGEQYKESAAIEPGRGTTVLDTPFGRLGLAVCYDLRFPELFRAMLEQEVQLIALPAAFTAATGRAHWESLVRARAIENLSYVLAAAQGGFHVNGRETYGHSMIVDPWGTVLAQRAGGTGVVVQDIDLDHQATTRRVFPALSHRRLRCG